MLTTLVKAPAMKKMTIVHACVSIWCLVLQCLLVMACTQTCATVGEDLALERKGDAWAGRGDRRNALEGGKRVDPGGGQQGILVHVWIALSWCQGCGRCGSDARCTCGEVASRKGMCWSSWSRHAILLGVCLVCAVRLNARDNLF